MIQLPANSAAKPLLKERAYSQLKELIQIGEFPAGMFLSERQLALKLGMSKTPIKAALERLEAEGFLSVAPQQGIVVRDLSVEEIADQFEIREALESYVLRALAGRLTAEDRSQIEANLAAQRAALVATDYPAIARLDADFHILFSQLLGNREILKTLLQLHDKVHRSIMRVTLNNPDRARPSVEEHIGIAEAVLAGDGDLATKRLVEHLVYGRQYLLQPRRGT
ncbi:FCD domain-containing protein [bacterium]|nr:FCD domain-containing protein [bacterium]